MLQAVQEEAQGLQRLSVVTFWLAQEAWKAQVVPSSEPLTPGPKIVLGGQAEM